MITYLNEDIVKWQCHVTFKVCLDTPLNICVSYNQINDWLLLYKTVCSHRFVSDGSHLPTLLMRIVSSLGVVDKVLFNCDVHKLKIDLQLSYVFTMLVKHIHFEADYQYELQNQHVTVFSFISGLKRSSLLIQSLNLSENSFNSCVFSLHEGQHQDSLNSSFGLKHRTNVTVHHTHRHNVRI